MLVNNRIIWSDNGTLKDLSVKLNNIYSGTETVDLIAAEDFIFLGSDMPFNHRYFDMSIVNNIASLVTPSIWDGSDWVPVVNVLDETSPATRSLGQSGIMSWTPDRDSGWSREDKTTDIPALADLTIYDMYWVRLAFDGDFRATTAIQYVGHKFCSDEELVGFYPDLADANRKTAFLAGKTTWVNEAVQASEIIVRDLRKRSIIWSASQILDWATFSDACVHKTAAIIYGAFGDNNKDDVTRAEEYYKAAMNQQVFNVDKDGDGILDVEETIVSTGLFRR